MSQTPPSEDNHLSTGLMLDAVAQKLGLPTEEVTSMLEAIDRGESRAEYFGFSDDVLRSIENIGLAYYRGQRFDEAHAVFEMMTVVSDGACGPAWRGLGACAQAQHRYTDAVNAYRKALAQNKKDDHSAVFLGECLCILGQRQTGLDVLRVVIERAAEVPLSEASHVRRAKAIVAAGGVDVAQAPGETHAAGQAEPQGKTQTEAAPNNAEDITEQLAEQTAQSIIHCLTTETEANDPDVRRMLKDPKTREQLEFLAQAVRDNRLTIRRIADFSQEQIDAGYALASQMLERGEALKAMESAAWMLWIDGRDTRFHRLIGLCLQHVKLWALADYFFTLVGIWREGGADAATLMYHGEVKVMIDEPEAGLDMLRRGISEAATNPAYKDIAQRSRLLLRQLEQRPA